MTLEQILAEVRTYDGVLELAPSPGSDHPEISWGDYFFYYAPDGQIPRNRQPFATVVMKDYPNDAESHLDSNDRWRLNIHVGSRALTNLVENEAHETHNAATDYTMTDVFNPHPLYGAFGWVCIVNPGAASLDRAVAAVRNAYLDDRRRVERRTRQAQPTVTTD